MNPQKRKKGSALPANDFIELVMETEIAFTVGKKIDSKIEDVKELKNYPGKSGYRGNG